MPSAFHRTRRSVLSFTVALLAFLVLADTLFITQQSHDIHQRMQLHTEHEFDLFGHLVSDALTRSDYAAVEQAAISWAGDQENIVRLKIVTNNGFELVDYSRRHDSESTAFFQKKIAYGDDREVNIFIEKDTSDIHKTLTTLMVQLVVISAVLVALLGFVIQRTALRPLQREIDLHKQTEGSLRQSISELELVNYSLSHDLRTPLRAITGYSQILRDDAGSKLNEDEQYSLKRIESAGKYMAELIDDILELSRISSAKLSISTVDVSKLARQCLENLLAQHQTHETLWEIQEGMTARADRRLIDVLLENLIDNAIKYTTGTKVPVIKLGTVEQNGNTVFYVRDNGVGFDMQFVDKLFKPFQRLHQDGSYRGTGIGLAIAARIVERHGGSIWAESHPGKGSTLYFTLS